MSLQKRLVPKTHTQTHNWLLNIGNVPSSVVFVCYVHLVTKRQLNSVKSKGPPASSSSSSSSMALTIEPRYSNDFKQDHSNDCRACGVLLEQLHHKRSALEKKTSELKTQKSSLTEWHATLWWKGWSIGECAGTLVTSDRDSLWSPPDSGEGWS